MIGFKVKFVNLKIETSYEKFNRRENFLNSIFDIIVILIQFYEIKPQYCLEICNGKTSYNYVNTRFQQFLQFV